MTILILANNDVGLYRFRRELIGHLCMENKVFFALPNGKMIPELEKIGGTYIPFEFHRRGMNPFADFKQFLRYVWLLHRIKPDVVLTYTIKPNIYGGLACQLTKTPYIASVTGLGTAVANGGLLGWLSITLNKAGLRCAACTFFQNESNLEFFAFKRIVRTKVRLIPGSGVNLTEHCPEVYPPNEGTTNFLFVGRIMRDKGIEELLAAMDDLSKKHPEVFLHIVGGEDEDYSQALEQAQKKGFVKYHGAQTDVHSFYKAAHCVVLPSYHEGMANVLLEAAATGRPVIATGIPGCMEAFDEGGTGFGCEVRSVESLAAAMEKFLALSQAERAEMGMAGRRKVEREFDRKIVVDAYMEEIRKLE